MALRLTRCLYTAAVASHRGAGHASALSALQSHGKRLYPRLAFGHDDADLPLLQAAERAALLDAGKRGEEPCRVVGRIASKRTAGTKLNFYDLGAGSERLQLVASGKDATHADFKAVHQALGRGDLVVATGFPGRTKMGEPSLFVTEMELLAPCLQNIPLQLEDKEAQVRQRHVHMLANPDWVEILRLRSEVLAHLRSFLRERGFCEVETPVLSAQAGGALARPFVTHANALGRDLTLRISPELYLKRLVVGGLDRVFEIGKVFRNEGIDYSHNPEFTMCELYQAYGDLEGLFTLTETLVNGLVRAANGSPTLHVVGRDEIVTPMDCTGPYPRISFVDELCVRTGVDLHTALSAAEFGDEAENATLIELLLDLCRTHGASCDAPHTAASLLDRLCGLLIEPQCVGPTFITHHPLCMSPLAKADEERPHLACRFELFIDGKEVCNAYEELNDPAEQRRRFAQQAGQRQAGDTEAAIPDESFCRALEYGLPPTAGWGMGLDRLIMLLAGQPHIRDVLAFPLRAEVEE